MSAIDYNNYIDSCDLGKTYTQFIKLPFYLQYWLKSKNETLKQMSMLAMAKHCFNRNGFCPTYGKRHAYSYGINRSISNHYPVR